jgi:hypothetical protein
MDPLLTEDEKIITQNPAIVYSDNELLVVSIYQGRHMREILGREETFRYQEKTYSKVACEYDVVEYDKAEIVNNCQLASEIGYYWPLQLGLEKLRQEPFLPHYIIAKGIILFLARRK